ncbi:MAG TPA: nicotinate-nicotinamide nucleotide adenylyltransferase [Patescibacteria group bacterium]|nr:nicotinate-nicotinamide nucleotide adenylyltransferase [Patescibacteria group bacterium]
MRVGIFSGTFDPVHKGHIAFALEAAKVSGLDRVVLLPEQNPRGKHSVSGHASRVALLQQAVAEHPLLDVITVSSPQFTVDDTLPELQQLFNNAELTFLLGSDVARSLGHWHNLPALLQAVSFVVGMRQGDDQAEIEAAMERVAATHGLPVRYRIIQSPHAALASTHIRNGHML